MIHIGDLPKIRGRYIANADLYTMVWFRVGGPCDILFKPEDIEDLKFFLANKPSSIPHIILGCGSNVLIRDGGIKGVVIKLGRGFSHVDVDNCTVKAGAAALDRTVALKAAQHGVGGLDFLSGIPGSIGGAVIMNAGAYGSDMAACLTSCTAIDDKGEQHTLTVDDLSYAYRSSALPPTWVITGATLQGTADEPKNIMEKIQRIAYERSISQPVKGRTGGSTFKNPEGKKAWQLIDESGCRGLTLGGACVSDKHCNFLINTGTATARDLEALGNTVQKTVQEKTGTELEWEIRRLGDY